MIKNVVCAALVVMGMFAGFVGGIAYTIGETQIAGICQQLEVR